MALDNPNTFSVALRQSKIVNSVFSHLPPPSRFPSSLDTFYGNHGIKTHLAELFHHPKSHNMTPVPENLPLDTSRSANSPLTAGIETRRPRDMDHGGDHDITSVDGVANFGSDTNSHVVL